MRIPYLQSGPFIRSISDAFDLLYTPAVGDLPYLPTRCGLRTLLWLRLGFGECDSLWQLRDYVLLVFLVANWTIWLEDAIKFV
jgi:hypothetical protein